jgi:hypothetical protein
VSNIRKLEGVNERQSKQYVIETLREQLEKAERGELLGIAIATVNIKHQCSWVQSGSKQFALLGALEVLRTAISKDLMER